MNYMLYLVIAHDAHGKLTRETNDIRVVLQTLDEWAKTGVQVDVVDNTTGEIWYTANPENGRPHCVEAFGLILLDYVLEQELNKPFT
jgi:hypothetical protein